MLRREQSISLKDGVKFTDCHLRQDGGLLRFNYGKNIRSLRHLPDIYILEY